MNRSVRTIALFLLAGAASCSRGDKREFLDPELPTNPSILARISVSAAPSNLVAEEMTHFTATGRTASGEAVPVEVDWRASGGVINPDGYFVADQAGSYSVTAVVRSRPQVADSVRFPVSRHPPRLVAVLVDPSPVSLPEGDSQAFTATSYFDDGTTTRDPVDWLVNGGLVDSTGLYVATGPEGEYELQAKTRRAEPILGLTRVKVTRRETVTGFAITPGSATLLPGQSVDFSGVQVFDDGSQSSPAISWKATGGTISNGGLYVAGTVAGNFKVIGKVVGGVRADTADILIQSPPIVSVNVTPNSATLAPGGGVAFVATGLDASGTLRVTNLNWTATGGTINSQGQFTAGSASGTFRVIGQVQGGTAADTSTVTVTAGVPTLVKLTVAPKPASIPAGTARQFAAAGQWSDGSQAIPPVTWSAAGGTITSNGVYTAGATTGSFRVIASHSTGLKDTSAVSVTPPSTTSISLSPKSTQVNVGQTAQFTASATLSTGAASTSAVIWTATGGTITSSGLYTAGSTPGSYFVIASEGGVADTGSVSVQAVATPSLTSVTVSPKTIGVAASAQQQFSVTGTWTGGTTGTPTVTWSSTGGTVSSGGLFTPGTTAGTYRVIAKAAAANLADTATVTVTTPTLVSMAVSPKTLSVTTGGTQQFSVGGTLSDGSSTVPSVSWTAIGGTVNSSGFFTAGTVAGTYRVIARHIGGTLADTSVVTITASTVNLTSVAVSPTTASVIAGTTKQFAVTGTFSNGTTATPAATWSATGGSVSPTGLYTAGSVAGTYRVIAAAQGSSLADTAVVTVTAAPTATLVALLLSPATTTLAPTGQQQFNAVGQYSDGTIKAAAVTWSVQSGAMAGGGLYTAPSAAGTYRIVATLQGGTTADTSMVTVLAAGPGAFPLSYDPARLGSELVDGESWQDLVLGSDSGYTSAMTKGWRQGTSPYPKPVPGQLKVEIDPTFGKVVRITHPDYHVNKFATTVEHMRSFPSVPRFWYRAVVRVSGNGNRNGQLGQGFTSYGTGIPGGSTTYKLLFAWPDVQSNRMEVVLHNDGKFLIGFGNLEPGKTETQLTQTAGTPSAPTFLRASLNGAEWRTNGDWYEFVLNYETVSATEYIQRYFVRRLTVNGAWNPWPTPAWSGYRITNGNAYGYNRINLGGNKSQSNDGPFDQYLWWGPYEVTTAVDPYGWDRYGK